MKILSIQVGAPAELHYRGQAVTTGILKKAVPGTVMLRTFNLDGDRQADLNVHGGRDKALYAYSIGAYADWRRLRPQDDFAPGAMGENLGVDDLDEGAIRVGDSFEIGAALVQATQPRFPCQKLAAKFQDPHILRQFMELGRPGVYFRVLREGLIRAGDDLKPVERGDGQPTIREVFLKQA